MSAGLDNLVPFLRTLRRNKHQPPRPIYPHAAEVMYRTRIRRMVSPLASLLNDRAWWIAEAIGTRRIEGVRRDQDTPSRAKKIARDLRGSFMVSLGTREPEQAARSAANVVSDHGRKEIARSLSGLGVDPIRSEAGIRHAIEATVSKNVRLIRSVPERYFDKLEAELVESATIGRSVDDIAARLLQGFGSEDDPDGAMGITMRRASIIARDQVASINGSLTRIRQRNIGARRYRWRTSRDERVRGNPGGHYPKAHPSHYEREGKVFSWDDPPEDGHPGEPILCRCTAEIVLEDLDLPSIDEEPGEFSFDPLSFLR